MRLWPALLAMTLLAAAGPVGAELGEEVVLDAEGALLLGTGGVGIGKVDDGAPLPPMGLPPPSLAIHRFHLVGCRALAIEVDYASSVTGSPAPETALLQAELRSAPGRVVAATLLADGSGTLAPAHALAAGAYELRIFHLVGGPVVYGVLGTARAAEAC